jgi:hypothetical protein
MTKSTTNVKPKKKMGRPVEIDADKFIGLRVPDALVKRIDGWAKREKIGERSVAVRELIERGLAGGRTVPVYRATDDDAGE